VYSSTTRDCAQRRQTLQRHEAFTVRFTEVLGSVDAITGPSGGDPGWLVTRHPGRFVAGGSSTTAAMTSWLGPLGPGFIGLLNEKSRRYFPVAALVKTQQR